MVHIPKRLQRTNAPKLIVPKKGKRFADVRHVGFKIRKNKLEFGEGFSANEPAVYRNTVDERRGIHYIPAAKKWFTSNGTFRYPSELNKDYLEQYGDAIVPLELTRPSEDSQTQTFDRFEAPLSLLLAHMNAPEPQETRLYLAQHSLADLPEALQVDLPTPWAFLSHLSGRDNDAAADIYASSLWMGRPPTRTPLHRDPNPNLFLQLAGKKTIRLMRPEVGKTVYETVRHKTRQDRGDANMRGEEMMQGKELEMLEKEVWQEEDYDDLSQNWASGWEATLRSGDALYIPVGWWHAVHGFGKGVNASVSTLHCGARLFADCDSRSTGGSDDMTMGMDAAARLQCAMVVLEGYPT
jgi:hypothetical protein